MSRNQHLPDTLSQICNSFSPGVPDDLIECPTCDGDGVLKDRFIGTDCPDCPYCRGEGIVSQSRFYE